jgi:hypothetical protein
MQQTRNSAKRNADDYKTEKPMIIEFFFVSNNNAGERHKRATFYYMISEVLLNAAKLKCYIVFSLKYKNIFSGR